MALGRGCGGALQRSPSAELGRALPGLEATCLRAVCVEVSAPRPAPSRLPVAPWGWPFPAWRAWHSAAARPPPRLTAATAQCFPLQVVN